MNKQPINFYFLSSGYCGTRFYHHLLRSATNAEVWHQPGHDDITEITDLLEERFIRDPEAFINTTMDEFPRLRRRIDRRLSLPWIYGDTLNWMRGLGLMLYRYIGPERLRLVELVRHPVAACRSMMTGHHRSTDEESSDIALAEDMARRWVRYYSYIRRQFEAINDPTVCRTVRLEDTGFELIRELYGFLSLEGFDETAISALLTNTAKDVRHQHNRDAQVPASEEELRAIWEISASLAEAYGYTEEEKYYKEAPSRPPGRVPCASTTDEGENRSPLVQLVDFRGLGLIVRCPSGIQHVNPCGGPMSFWLRTEGAFVPLAEDGEGTPGRRLFEYFLLRRKKEFMSRIQESDADFIDSVLADRGIDFIKVNRSRIGENWDLSEWRTWTWDDLCVAPWEAWVPVGVRSAPYSTIQGVLSGYHSTEAVLVWENSN